MAQPQKSKRDRFSTKVHDRIAMQRVDAAIRRDQEEQRQSFLAVLSDLASTRSYA